MKFEVFNSKTVAKSITYLALEEDSGIVTLIIVDKKGKRVICGSVLSITKEGKLNKHPSVSAMYGLSLDKKGKIKEIGDK